MKQSLAVEACAAGEWPSPAAQPSAPGPSTLVRIATVPIYRSDAVLRRAPALQAHPLTGEACSGPEP